jgi:hypothetical protein
MTKNIHAVLWRKRHKGRKVIRLAISVGILACLLGNEPARGSDKDQIVNVKVDGLIHKDSGVLIPSFDMVGERCLMRSVVLQYLICHAANDQWSYQAVPPVLIKFGTGYTGGQFGVVIFRSRDKAPFVLIAGVMSPREFSNSVCRATEITYQRETERCINSGGSPGVSDLKFEVGLSFGSTKHGWPKPECLDFQRDHDPSPLIGYQRGLGDLSLAFASTPQQDGGDAKHAGENDQPKGKESNRVRGRLLPQGFALFTLVAAVLSGVVTLLFFYFGRRIRGLPSEYSNPKYRCYEESNCNLRIEQTPISTDRPQHLKRRP